MGHYLPQPRHCVTRCEFGSIGETRSLSVSPLDGRDFARDNKQKIMAGVWIDVIRLVIGAGRMPTFERTREDSDLSEQRTVQIIADALQTKFGPGALDIAERQIETVGMRSFAVWYDVAARLRSAK